MPLLQSLKRPTELLLAANLAVSAFVLLGLAWISARPEMADSEGTNQTEAARKMLAGQVQLLRSWLASELEKPRRDVRAIAESATHIFSNPESYRLAAQPGEYDYDSGTGLYGSVRNEGASVAFLSAASSLSPEILREIRLSEYLNPLLRTSALLNELYQSIGLYTTDSLVRSYPWFDFKSHITSGDLRRDFQVTSLPSFAAAMPSRNPGKQTSCDLTREDLRGKGTQWVCSAPFFAGDLFRGVVTVALDFEKLGGRLFEIPLGEILGLVASREGQVLCLSAGLKKLAPPGFVSGSLTLRDLKLPGLASLEPLLMSFSGSTTYFARQGGFFVATGSVGNSLERIVVLLPETATGLRTGRSAPAFPLWLRLGAVLACGLLLLVNAAWILESKRRHRDSEKQLEASFTAFSDLNLGSALGKDPPALIGALQPDITEESGSAEPLRDPEPDSLPSVPSDAAGGRASVLAHQLAVVLSFEAGDSLDANLSSLCAVLRAIFSAPRVSFLSYSPAESALQAPSLPGNEQPAMWKGGALFQKVVDLRQTVCSNAAELDPHEKEALASVISGNYLVTPLLDEGELTGAVVLADKDSGFSREDQDLMAFLQEPVARTLNNLYQCEGLARLNSLRREYCLLLARAVETPLDKIRGEVQTIYSRLGSLTPYYKQHCETMLFEIGKLYEMVRAAQEGELAAAPGLPSAVQPPQG